jgi:hypothetical protein
MARRGSDDGRLQAELERLYALSPPAFTTARNELAARLRQEGRRDDAAAVKALPRPTPSSWAVSRLMRLEPARFQALLAAGREARQAQRRVLDGRPGASAAPATRLRETLQSARTLIEELRRRGLELLAATGRPATAANADRLGADLQALAFTAGAESAIERGWLDHDLDAPGFEVLAGLQAAAGAAAAAARPRETVAKQAPADRGRRDGSMASAATEPRPKGSAGTSAGSAGTSARRLEESRQRQASEHHEREQARLQLARDRQRARLANAEAEMERAAAESARLEAAATAAEQEATAANRRAAEAQRDAERAGRGAEQARRVLDRARERLEAIRAAAEPDLKA